MSRPRLLQELPILGLPLGVLWLDASGSSVLFLTLFAGAGVLAGVLYKIGWVGKVLQWVSRTSYRIAAGGFTAWKALFSWAPWPVFLALVVVLHVLAWSVGEPGPGRVLLCGLVLIFLGVTACLAYIFLDLERYEVGRGYKVLHNPLKGQELAVNLAHYGHRVGMPLLISATVATISGFAMLNEGLYQTVGASWYTVGKGTRSAPAAEVEPADPQYADFLAYTLINLSRVVDLVDVANTYNYTHITYVRQARWPASTLLALFKTFFTTILLQQIFSSVRQFKLLGETIQELWSPHEPIQERARGSLSQHGASVVAPLLHSLRSVAFLTTEQRAEIPQIIADVGPATLPLLRKYLNDPSENVRAVAVRALGHLHAVDALPALVQVAGDPSEWVRQSLVETLHELCGPDARATRKRWSIRMSWQLSRRWLGWAFRVQKWMARTPESNPMALTVLTLRALLSDSVAGVRSRAAVTLGQLGTAAVAAAPELIALLGDADESVRCQACESLGKIGSENEQAVAALTAALQDPSQAVKVAAAQALGAHKEEAASAQPALIPLLQSRDEPVRQAAAEALRETGTLDEDTTPHLIAGLASEDSMVRAQTAEALGTIGESAVETVPALVTALQDSNDRVRVKAAEALGKMGQAAAEAVPGLTHALEDADHRVSALAAEALGNIGADAIVALPALLEALRHRNGPVRGNATQAIGQLMLQARQAGKPLPLSAHDCYRALEEAANDEDGGVRRQAVLALGEAQETGVDALRPLLHALEDRDAEVRSAGVEALSARGEGGVEVVQALLPLLHDSSDQVKTSVAKALPRLASATPEVVAGLCGLLEDDTAEVQANAALALGKFGPEARAAGAALLRILQTGDVAVREQVLRAMVLIQPPEAVTAFMAGLLDAEGELRKLASAGLMKTAEVPPEVLPLLLEALKDPQVQVRSNAAYVLGRLDTLPAEAVPLLVECTADPDDGLRLHAARALQHAAPEALGDALQHLIEDSNIHIRLHAARGVLLENADHAKAVEILTAALADPAIGLRKTAVEMIDSLGATASVFLEVVKERVEVEDEPEVRASLARLAERLDQQKVPAPAAAWNAEETTTPSAVA